MMYRRWSTLLLLVVGAWLLIAIGWQSQRIHDEAKAVVAIDYVYSGISRDGSRIRSAVLSADFVCDLEPTELERLAPQIVDGLALLLEDSEFASHAASVLGCIGPPARAAVPALERALKKATPADEPGIVIQPQFRLDNVIRSALKRVRGEQ
jgi:hypothetical protein